MQVNPFNFGLVSLTDPKKDLLAIKVEVGQTYYLRFKLGFGKVTMEEVPADLALKQIARCELVKGVDEKSETDPVRSPEDSK